MPVVYIDVVWLVNFVMDAILLMTAGWVAKRPIRVRRIASGALLGSLYALLLFLPSLSALTTWPGKAIVSLLMVYLALPCRSWLDLARTAALFYFVAFVFAGATLALHFAVPGVSVAKGVVVSGNRVAFVTGLQSLALLVAIPLSAALIKYVVRKLRHAQVHRHSLYRVDATIGDRTVRFVGLMDTGNQLRDPVSRRPVCFVDATVMAELLPDSLRDAVSSGADLLHAVGQMNDREWVKRITLVPFRGAGGSQQIAVAVRPDLMLLSVEGDTVMQAEPCLLAVHLQKLSHDDRFQAILHTDVIAGDERLENASATAENQRTVTDPTAVVVDPNSSKTSWRH